MTVRSPFILNEFGAWCPGCQEAVEDDEACPHCGYPDIASDDFEDAE